ncbi:iron uptake porin [Pantanalinema sp. GBBB05]|uniref:iron uptake porin n=1 Tax=Pantanalinema sp. GBBB05 TaxID=2604139 RepID=UPI001D6F95E4|nr:porin [Pantanalinema sp. GBBB05]
MRNWNLLCISLMVLGGSTIAVSPALASELSAETKTFTSSDPLAQSVDLEEPLTDFQTLNADANGMEQVTSVSQLTDVKPTDWAFQALQSLVERYGCIVGYPDRTYRGNRSLTRYEFAAGLNACLDKVQELITAATADLVRKEDLVVVQRLQEEFAVELATLQGRVDTLEVRTATLEKQQFSTTTKLAGNAIFSVADIFGADGGSKNQAVFQARANLNFNTSFNGYDLLFVSLYAGNVPLFPIGGFRLPSTTAGGLPVNSAEGALDVAFGGNTDNRLQMLGTGYVFPISPTAQVFVVGGNTALFALVPTVNPLLDDKGMGTGAISLFGQRNAIYALGAAGAGAGINWQFGKQFIFSGAYIADGFGANNPDAGSGLFNGGYTAFGQITWNPSARFSLAATYTNTYFAPGRFGFNYNGLPLEGTAVANTLAGQTRLAPGPLFNPSPVITNSYGVQASYQFSPAFVVSGWFGATYARLIGDGDGTILNYALTLAFPDLGKRGNLLGFVIGAEPYLTDFDGGNPKSFKTDIPFHLEGFYRYQINDRISLTPGVIVLTAPNQDASNGVDVIANLRMTVMF